MTTSLRIVCVAISLWSAAPLVQAAAAGSRETVEQMVDRLFQEAAALDRKGDLAGVEAKMTEVIAVKPSEPGGYYNRAQVRRAMKRFDEAKEDINKFLKLLPGHEDGLVVRARINLEANNYQAAIIDTSDVLRRNADNHDARLIRAESYKLMRGYRAALEDYRKLREKDVEDDAILASEGQCELMLAQYSDAKVTLRRLLGRVPENGWAHYQFGQAQFGTLEFEAAIASYRKAESLKFNRVDTQRSIGYCHFARKDDANAIAVLKEVIKEHPAGSPYVYFVLHLALQRAERPMAESPLREAMAGWESEWARSLARYLLGEMSDHELLRLAKAATQSDKRDEQLCEAYYYIGMGRQRQKDVVAAELLFERVLQTQAKTFVEFTFSRTELPRR